MRIRVIAFCVLLIGAAPAPKPVLIYGSLSGRPTFDADARGGNPFASALIELLSRPSLSFATFKTELIARTRAATDGAQQPEIVGGEHLAEWQFLPKPANETRVALVVVFSDYSRSRGRSSLPGAKRDQRRVTEALARAGFDVLPLLDPDRQSLTESLNDFALRSARADVAVVYTTGHGEERHGAACILLPEREESLRVSELAKTARARRANLVFYAACRTRRQDAGGAAGWKPALRWAALRAARRRG